MVDTPPDEGRTRTRLPDELDPGLEDRTPTAAFWVEGRVYGRYRLEGLLGAGGFGEVFLATDLQLKRKVAIKTLLPRHAAHPELRRRFLKEAEVLAAMDHPGIIKILELGDSPEEAPQASAFPWFAMEYVDRARPLNRLLDEAWAPSPREAAKLVLQFARALAHVHGRGYVHRDVKTANVLIHGVDDAASQAPKGELVVKLIDLGIAKEEDASMGFTGTPAYQAPEVVAAGAFSPVSDVYALGVMLYELLVNASTPWGETSRYEYLSGIRSRHYLRPRVLDPGIPSDLEEIVLKAVERDIFERYRSANELADDLEAWLDGRVPAAASVGAASRVIRTGRKAVRRHRLAVGVIAASVAVLLAVGLWVWAGELRRAGEKQAREAEDRARALADRTFMDAGERGATSGELAEVQLAITTYTRALEADPGHLRARYYRGRAFQRLGRHGEALPDLRYVVEHQPENVDARYYHARSAYLAGATAAEVLPELWLVARDDSPGTLGRLARIQILLLDPPRLALKTREVADEGKIDAEVKAQLERIEGDHPDVHIYRAMNYTGFPVARLAREKQAVPDYFGFWISETYKPLVVLEHLDRAIKSDPLNYVAHQGRGEVLANLGRYEEALASLDKALRILPSHVPSLRMRAMVRWVTGDPAGMVADFDEVLRWVTPEMHHDFRDMRIYSIAALLALDAGRRDLAEKFFHGPDVPHLGTDNEQIFGNVLQICAAYAIYDGRPAPAVLDPLLARTRNLRSDVETLQKLYRITRLLGFRRKEFDAIDRLFLADPNLKLRLKRFVDELGSSGTTGTLQNLLTMDPTRVRLFTQLLGYFRESSDQGKPWWPAFGEGFGTVFEGVPIDFCVAIWTMAMHRAEGGMLAKYEFANTSEDFVRMANFHYLSRDYAAASRAMEQAVAKTPSDPELHYGLACCYALAGNREAGIRELKIAQTYGWGTPEWAAQDPDFAPLAEDPDFKLLTAKGGAGMDVWFERAMLERVAPDGKLPGAPDPRAPGTDPRTYAPPEERRDPELAYAELFRRAVEAYRGKRFTEAEELFSAAIGFRLHDARVWYARGRIRLEAFKDHPGALADFNQALALSPGIPMVLHDRGFARWYLGDKQGAAEDWRAAAAGDASLAAQLQPWIQKAESGD